MKWSQAKTPINEKSKRPQKFFESKRIYFAVVFVIIAILTYFASTIIGFDFFLIFKNMSQALNRFITLYLPPNFSEYPDLLDGIWMTIVLSITAGCIGTFLAYFSAIATSKATGKNKFLQVVLRFLATFIRNVPASIWAITLLMAFWYGEFLALLVMTLSTYAFIARIFSDMIDETNRDSIEALEATGASYWQVIAQAVFPETLPVTISWALYSVESNIRSATIIGMLAGGGIGYLIGIYKNFRHFDQLAAAVICIVVVILAFDQISMQIRKRIL